MHCLICNDSIKHARLGVDSCRACAAFYKRTDRNSGKLKCKDGRDNCLKNNPKTTCRKCRLERFKEVLARASEAPAVTTKRSVEAGPSTAIRQSSFIDHTSFHEPVPTTSKTPLLDRLRRGFSLMCLIRKSGELAMKQEAPKESDINVNNLTLTIASYTTVIPMTRISKEAIIELGNLAFDNFRSLDGNSKKSLVEESFPLLNQLESSYRVCHHFPGDNEIRLSGYTTYVRTTDLAAFFDNCKDDVDKANLIKQFEHYLEQSAKIVRQFFEIVKPTDMEFVALFGLALWNDEAMNGNEALLSIGRRIRSEIMRELHVYYAMSGTADYASRVGHIFCLLVNCQNHSEKTAEDVQVWRLMRLFESEFKKQ